MTRQALEKPTSTNQRGLYCQFTSSEVWERDDCNGRPHMDFKGDLGKTLFDWEIGNWVKEVNSTIKKMSAAEL